jgi:hypothetical protein
MRFLLLLLLSPNIIYAQTQEKILIGGGAHITFSNAINTSTDKNLVPGKPYTYVQYSESVKQYQSGRVTLGFSAQFQYALSKKRSIQTGLTYLDIGFQRKQEGINFKDSTYPGMGTGRVEELSGSTKSITYNYRYQYLQIPILVNFIVSQTRDLKYTHRISAGFSTNILLNHDIKAKLDEFVVDGEEVFKFDSTGYEAARFGFNLLFGYKLDIKGEDKQLYYIQPMIGISPISVSTTPLESYPIFLQLNVGMLFSVK